MKYINFEKVSIKNFLSVGDVPVEVNFNAGLNIITGLNKDKVDRRNGVGKSTIADSIYFAIYGDTLRPVKKDHIVNNINQKNCEVCLEFDVNFDGENQKYKVVRTLNPSKCYLYKNGQDITRDSIQNTTEYIVDLINTTSDVFQNCIIMTVNNAIPFMAKKKLEKRKFIEGIFNLQVFSNMLSEVRSEFNSVVRELDIECAKFEEISSTLNAYNEQKSAAHNTYKRNKSKLESRMEVNTINQKKLTDQLSDTKEIDTRAITEKLSELDGVNEKLQTGLQTIISKKSKIETTIRHKQATHDKITSEHSTCPTCLSKLDENHKSLIESEKNKMMDEITGLKQKLKNCDAKYNEISDARQTIKAAKKSETDKLTNAQLIKEQIKNIKQQLDQLISQNKDIEDDLKSLETNDTGFDKHIKETEDKLNKSQGIIDDVKKKMADLEIIKYIVSEEGVKSYIVRKILQLFNAKLSHYLKKMDSNCICVFNEYFEEEIIDEKGKLCSYFNFSGAERKNIDLACLFAFMDIRRVQGDVAFNFSMYDELFDSSLDERGVELVIDILKERIEQHKECIMVISHRKESTKLATGEIIFLEKQKGMTVRVDTPEADLK